MNEEQIELLIEYIKAKIAEHEAKNHSDGGLVESNIANTIEYDLRTALKEDE